MVEVAKVTMFGLDVGSFVWDDSYKVARFEYPQIAPGSHPRAALGLRQAQCFYAAIRKSFTFRAPSAAGFKASARK